MTRLIAIDLDGTLLRDDKSLSEANTKAIQAAIAADVKVAICTGRPLEAIQHILDQLQTNTHEHYSITYNGGLIIQNETRQVMAETVMTLAEADQIAKPLLALHLPVVAVAIDTVYEYPYPEGHPSNYHHMMSFLPFEKLQEAQLSPQTAIYKLVVGTEKNHLEQQLPAITRELFDRYAVMRSHPHQLEIMPKGVDKGRGLAELAQVLGIPQAEVMGIGDEENDIAMLQWAGTAIVMGNGREDVKALADYVTATNEADGVAEAINHFVFNK